MSALIGATKTLFSDNFSTNGKISSQKWDYNHFDSGGSFYGRTQQRQTLPEASNGVLHLKLDTFNPTGPGAAFLGSEAITKMDFGLQGGAGVAFQVKARFVNPMPGGIVGGFFSYGGPAATHDEIDYEALSNDLVNGRNRIQTNVYAHEPLGAGHPAFEPISSPLTSYHTYRIEWLPDRVTWYVDGKQVRVEKTHVPQDPQKLHLNIWAPAADWAEAFNSALQPAGTKAANKTYTFDVTSVLVQQLSSAYGTAASDSLAGASVNDWIDGGQGADRVTGAGGDDVLLGGGGEDQLRGGGGDDTLGGGAGDDVLFGGVGADRLAGADGADRFAFRSPEESTIGAGRDTVADFDSDEGDRIDVREIDANAGAAGDQAFEFIGRNAFTGNAGDPLARGEIRFEAVDSGVLVSGDVDGDQVADFEIFLADAGAPKAADFLL